MARRDDPPPQYSESDQGRQRMSPQPYYHGPAAGSPPDERSSLLSPRPKLSAEQKRRYLLCGLVSLLVIISYFAGTGSSLNPKQREKIRQEWERDLRLHQDDVKRFKVEQRNMTSARYAWTEERNKWEQKRYQWKDEETKIARREQELKHNEEQWKKKQEEERRTRDSFRWINITPSTQCMRYGVREYTATFFPGHSYLSHFEILTGCSNTEAIILGRTYPKPDYCHSSNGQYIGHWTVEEDPDCVTYFEGWQDKGCVAPGSSLHRYEAHLMTLRPEDDGQMMCATTPARLKGKAFSQPNSCVYWGKYGWWGIYFVEDFGCENLQAELETPEENVETLYE